MLDYVYTVCILPLIRQRKGTYMTNTAEYTPEQMVAEHGVEAVTQGIVKLCKQYEADRATLIAALEKISTEIMPNDHGKPTRAAVIACDALIKVDGR